jgi:hypothetical protein
MVQLDCPRPMVVCDARQLQAPHHHAWHTSLNSQAGAVQVSPKWSPSRRQHKRDNGIPRTHPALHAGASRMYVVSGEAERQAG